MLAVIKRPLDKLPLRWRLTVWYLLTLSLILLIFATFLYLQLRANLRDQLDITLQLAVSQLDGTIAVADERLVFADGDILADQSIAAGLYFYLLDEQGNVWERIGQSASDIPLPPLGQGYEEVVIGDDIWRTYSEAVAEEGLTGWLVVTTDTDPINDTLDRLLTLMLIGGPLVLLLAGLGGFFLASRALQPIDQMTQTAQQITANDLNQRLLYEGPADEVGRLAETFDQMLDRLQQAFARERRFTGDAAHELRTPLTALKGRLEVTLSQSRDSESYVATLREMESQVDRLIRLSGDLLYMSRLEQGHMTPELENIAAADFLAAVIDQLRTLADVKSITIVEDVPAALSLQGNLDLLIRLFLNLLDNAVKYTPAGGQINVRATQQSGQVLIAIEDSGPGIPAEHIPHLFDRFYRVQTARSRQDSGGAGLGLAIAQEIVRLHRGEIRVESAVNAGTTLIVSLPQTVQAINP